MLWRIQSTTLAILNLITWKGGRRYDVCCLVKRLFPKIGLYSVSFPTVTAYNVYYDCFFESFTLNGFQVFNKTGSMKQPLHFSFTWPVVWISWFFKCQSKLRLIALQTTTKATNFPESSLFAFCTYQLPWWSYETNLTRLVVEEMSSIITHHALRAKRFPQHFVSYLI